MKDDQNLSEQFGDDWWQRSEPQEITRIGNSIARSTALRPAKDDAPRADRPDPNDPPEPGEKGFAAGDKKPSSVGLDGAIALDRAAYFATELSAKIAATPEGYLICRNCVIGRTGFQVYKIHEIMDPEGLLEAAGIVDPEKELEIWRDPAEVFSRATLASFEGKSFTLGHPSELLDPETEQVHHQGHVTNVRAGSEPLGNGELPLLADIVVTGADAIRAVQNGARELSCGYSYRLARTGYRWEQRDIVGNHVALVPQGRAGSAARIYDALPSATGRKPLSEIAAMDTMYRDHGRRQVETVRNSIRIRRPL